MVFPTPGYQTVREFVRQSYQLVSASSPTVGLHGSDESFGILILNQLLQSYAGPGLMLTIAKFVQYPLTQIGQKFVTFGDAATVPTPDVTMGRLATLDSAWLLLDGVTYPLIQESRDAFLASYKYFPLKGLPRFVIVFPDTQITTLQIYPSPSQFYELNIRGKFQLPVLTSNSDMSLIPQYYVKYLLLALAKELSLYKGRAEAWSQRLEQNLQDEINHMVASSEINVAITGDRESLLNGSWRVRAGI